MKPIGMTIERVMSTLWRRVEKLDFGLVPKEYNAKIHGPYMPNRLYGKADTPFSQLKLKDIPAWFSRREKTPMALTRLLSRKYWNWQMQYVQARYSNAAPYYQLITMAMLFFYIIRFDHIYYHQSYRYHW